VFISLTHHWNSPEGTSLQRYRPKEILDRLAEYSRLEGDFEWRVAYHPYPQGLFQAAAWNDTRPTFSFDSHCITPKNIEVLDAYLHRAPLLYKGEKLRTVLLSEQGFHTKDYSPEAQQLQERRHTLTRQRGDLGQQLQALQATDGEDGLERAEEACREATAQGVKAVAIAADVTDPAAPLRLILDSEALVSNWRALARMSGHAACGAAVKANGYGLGATGVAQRLAAAGVETWPDPSPAAAVAHVQAEVTRWAPIVARMNLGG
jgi:hypothetical protein